MKWKDLRRAVDECKQTKQVILFQKRIKRAFVFPVSFSGEAFDPVSVYGAFEAFCRCADQALGREWAKQVAISKRFFLLKGHRQVRQGDQIWLLLLVGPKSQVNDSERVAKEMLLSGKEHLLQVITTKSFRF